MPPYTPSPPSPRYSSEPLPGEQIVEFTRRASSRSPTGVYRRITDHLTVILRDQHPGSVYPVYGRGGLIQGDVILSNTSGLTSVILKLEGNFLLHASGIPLSNSFLSVTHVLWSASHAHCCPRTIPFGVIFPLTFDDGDQARALPPTFKSSELHATSSYSLTIELSRPRQFLPFWKGNEAVKVPLMYRPQSRPPLPMLPSDLPFMSTVKSSPEEWHEVMCTIPMTQGSGLAHAECLLFIPSVHTFALSDTIPFHLQIRGSPASLIPFLEQDQGGRQGTNGQLTGGVIIRVYILRQSSARIHGQSAIASRNLGEGKMEPSESLHSRNHIFARHPLGDDLDSLDWDGVLRCGEDVTAPSFSTNQLSVKDSIVLSITPRQPLKSPLLGVRHSCPIRLVTDSWSNDAVT
ncbi:hypothetical protein L210DRAFT_3396728 [Boletus edulis BED1]|uniref:Uncharacterized protein n=1 Tax=Boletus edulis BED1 TaxID=1328754 RepID=A0AAD4GG47_BOLED|nr:hypothetical protein L210DRAFT_3396728 [Boletus edulis BED1]